ncbi:hypothetical protein [Micromonospora sp. NBC_01813]|uniref:hypothetical protein n=1 Tax=Micromonospora sp. NBC_01813 TaxID=2975988 RepID=UPI002DD805AC|nr:hypothetical protein [Micromonospora sp. NBC_01813]WSA06623.1 hypothetical protein OG958_20270 [Micromonospora sp. NBC_01813]
MTGVNAVPAGSVRVVGFGSERRRAQLVFTVANLDTGAVASTSLVPGSFTPLPTPGGTWWLPYAPIVTDLAARAGVAAATLRDPDFPDEPGRRPSSGLMLPIQWQPGIPERERHNWEAVALADRRSTPWLVLLGRATAPPAPDHARLLGRLCALADQLHVDLVIEARPSSTKGGLSWDIRFELAGGKVPDYAHRWAADLPTALARISPQLAASGLSVADRDTPAHFLPDDALTPHPVPVGLDGHPGGHDLDQLERRMVSDAEQHGGAQAIWRNRHWWHTSLRPDDTESSTPVGGRFRRGWEPPTPKYWGEAIPTHPCTRCADVADPPYCTDCYGTRQVRRGVVVTVTDLRGRTVHRNWRPDDDPTPPVRALTDRPSGTTVWQLPEHYQVGPMAAGFGVQPTDLTDLDGEHVLDQHFRTGVSEVGHWGGDPVAAYLAEAAAAHDGARILVRANDWPGPTLDELARLVRGLGLALDLTVTDHADTVGHPELLQGHSWSVQVAEPAAPMAVDPVPTCAALPEAVALCHRYLYGALRATIPADPEKPMSVPQQAASAGPAPDTAAFITEVRRLAATQPGHAATIRLHPDGTHTTSPDDPRS